MVVTFVWEQKTIIQRQRFVNGSNVKYNRKNYFIFNDFLIKLNSIIKPRYGENWTLTKEDQEKIKIPKENHKKDLRIGDNREILKILQGKDIVKFIK